MWDRQKKKELGYEHPKSRVWTDTAGNVIREVLHGADWTKRKYQLWRRCGGQCEYELRPGVRCQNDCHDPCHDPLPRHPQRNDMLSNLKGGCRNCHLKHEPQSWRKVRSGKVAA